MANGTLIHQWDFHGHWTQEWTFERYSGYYYTIKSTVSGTPYYMSTDGSTVKLKSNANGITDDMLWYVSYSDYGNIKIAPKARYLQNYVMAVAWDGTNQEQNGLAFIEQLYSDDAYDTDEWELVDRYFTYVNYFDSSIANDSTLLANIQEANQFASNMYAKYFGLPFKIVDATRLDVVETCPGNDQPCIESCDTDGSKCSSNHHKGGLYISNYLYGRSREENHVYTLWTNRPEKTYCHYDSDTGVHDQVSWIAVVYGYRPVIQFMTLFGENSDQVKACMTLNLVHETAHTFGMGDVYNDVGHDVSNATVCVMEKFDMNTSVEFYELVANGLVSPFCSSCMEELSPYVETCYHAANVN